MKIALSFGVLLLVVVSAGAGGYYLASRNDDDNGGPVSLFDQADVTEELTVAELETTYGVETVAQRGSRLTNDHHRRSA